MGSVPSAKVAVDSEPRSAKVITTICASFFTVVLLFEICTVNVPDERVAWRKIWAAFGFLKMEQA